MAFLPDPKRDAAAERLAESAHLWPVVTLRQQWGAFPAGSRFYSVPSRSNPGTAWLANDRACQCPDYQQRGSICAHVRAVVLYQERQRQSQGGSADSADPTPTAATADPDGSRAYLARLQGEQAAHARALRAAGTDPADDATYRQRAEHIARLESRHTMQARAAVAAPARPSYADVFGADD